MIPRVEQKLTQDPNALLAWEPIRLDIYGERLPDVIRSSWVFVLRARENTGAERHPESCQRMMSYRGSGDLQIWNDDRWCHNLLVSDSHARIERRWVSIAPNTWHQAVVPENNWVVVSFHSVAEHDLIEERPDVTASELSRQRRYLDEQK